MGNIIIHLCKIIHIFYGIIPRGTGIRTAGQKSPAGRGFRSIRRRYGIQPETGEGDCRGHTGRTVILRYAFDQSRRGNVHHPQVIILLRAVFHQNHLLPGIVRISRRYFIDRLRIHIHNMECLRIGQAGQIPGQTCIPGAAHRIFRHGSVVSGDGMVMLQIIIGICRQLAGKKWSRQIGMRIGGVGEKIRPIVCIHIPGEILRVGMGSGDVETPGLLEAEFKIGLGCGQFPQRKIYQDITAGDGHGGS